MRLDIELHPIQTKILNLLSLKTRARFSELNSEKISNDQFNFHLKRLINLELVNKDLESGLYELTIL